MKREVFLRPAARRDLVQCLRYLQCVDEPLVQRFQDAVLDTAEFLRRYPYSGRPAFTDACDRSFVRIKLVNDFRNHVLVYRCAEDERIDIIRVLHVKQDYWRFR